MNIITYLDNINRRFKTGISREHAYRGDLQTLLENLTDGIDVINEPARIECGSPDYVLNRKNVPVGYIEAKDIGINLNSKTLKEQFDRYKKSLPNLIFTDYLDFHLYIDGELATTIAIAKIENDTIIPLPENYAQFTNLIKSFVTHVGQTIKSATKLSAMMAGKAKLLAKVIENAINSDVESQQNSSIKQQMDAFKTILIHDITPKAFADLYAQTIAYGMFAARLHDDTLEDFSRQEAANLIPKTNPFLRRLFQYISGYDIDERIEWIVTALADIFRATDVKAILTNFGKATQMQDPIIHFYENFLAEYDPKLRKARGVWYTPAPVVNFIVRAVDDILKTEFNLKKGLADTSKTKIKVNTQKADKRTKARFKQVEQEVHRVQILDPATGTGTFLAEIITHIHQSHFKAMQGMWSGYVENDLIPRLNGFELLMASYAMAHLKMDLLLAETGYKPQNKNRERFRIFLTNSLEESHPDTGTLFASWLSDEANAANHVKRNAPVMVILGNPPYSGESANKGEWIMKLMDDYKKEPNTTEKLKEKNPKWINDDYVKFLRYGQHFIERNKTGVLAFINPHGFLDNPTFRGMRWNLLKTYDKIYTIDLHGNSKKKEVCPDGSPDQNVFDIMQGVSINLFVKTGKKQANQLGEVFHYDLYGKRNIKYDFLRENSLGSIAFTQLPNKAPMYFMVQKDFELEGSYKKGFSLNELFIVNGVGLTTAHDSFVIKDGKEELHTFYKEFQSSERDEELLHKKFEVRKKKGWNILEGYDNIKNEENLIKYIKPISYRPFDSKYIFYEDKLVWRTVRKVMQHFLKGDNVGLVFRRQQPETKDLYVFCSNKIIADGYIRSDNKGGESIAPLYLYSENNSANNLFEGAKETPKRTPNLKPEIVQAIAKKLGIPFVAEKEETKNTFAPIDLLDYIYAVLHSPNYREKYKEFLKIDFPRVPYPKNVKTFWQLVNLGSQIRQIHLLEADEVENYITGYPVSGNNVVSRKMTKNSIGFELTDETTQSGKVWINDDQYFEGVPLIAWNFYIGGYQPAQKWLKDRFGRELSFDDLLHYQKIIVALTRTHELMQAIDEIEIE